MAFFERTLVGTGDSTRQKALARNVDSTTCEAFAEIGGRKGSLGAAEGTEIDLLVTRHPHTLADYPKL
ncbi:MAG TPA: hypothetical protein VHK01_17710 [Lacipirellulaceae bacterium]|jgi:hypothetical protein|nr:hypothetical protein [Lacipirellulaceae bacterium]